jgi:hypothetical protein
MHQFLTLEGVVTVISDTGARNRAGAWARKQTTAGINTWCRGSAVDFRVSSEQLGCTSPAYNTKTTSSIA